jgi:cell division protein FtsN
VPIVNVTKPTKVTKAPAEKIEAVPLKKTAAKKSGTASHRYIISLGEYKKYEDAQKRRAALILSGLDVTLTKVGSQYRLETGPYENWRQAHAAQLSLEQQQQIRGKIVQ